MMCGAASGRPRRDDVRRQERHPLAQDGEQARPGAPECGRGPRRRSRGRSPPRRRPGRPGSPRPGPPRPWEGGCASAPPCARRGSRPRPGRPTCARCPPARPSPSVRASTRATRRRRPAAAPRRTVASAWTCGEGLDRPDLVVDVLHRRERDPGGAHGPAEGLELHLTLGVDGHERRLRVVRTTQSAALSTAECSTALATTMDPTFRRPRASPRTPACTRVGARGGEGDLLGQGPDARRRPTRGRRPGAGALLCRRGAAGPDRPIRGPARRPAHAGPPAPSAGPRRHRRTATCRTRYRWAPWHAASVLCATLHPSSVHGVVRPHQALRQSYRGDQQTW